MHEIGETQSLPSTQLIRPKTVNAASARSCDRGGEESSKRSRRNESYEEPSMTSTSEQEFRGDLSAEDIETYGCEDLIGADMDSAPIAEGIVESTIPASPTAAERSDHDLHGHTVFKPWCDICVQG